MSSAGSSAIRFASPARKASLYVGNLPPNVTEAKLLEKFSAAGAVCWVRVCLDKATKRFLGYAYVTFRREEDALRALVTLNGSVIWGRQIRVKWAERNSSQPDKPAEPQKSKSLAGSSVLDQLLGLKPVKPAKSQKIPKLLKNCEKDSQNDSVGIFITGLNPVIQEGNLRALFSSSGNIVDCGVVLDDGGRSKGFGFVQFESEEAVEGCLEKVKSWLLTGSTFSVTKLFTNVHVFNFGYRLNFGSLHKLFEPFGTIIDYRVVKNFGRFNGFGYVTFGKLKSAAHAIAELNGKDLGDGLKLKVEAAPIPSSTREVPSKHDEGVNLYIKIYETSIGDERLQELFAPFGPIISVKVFIGPKDLDHRTGFVRFASNEDAQKAIAEMNGKIVGSGPLSVSLAITKNAKSTPDKQQKPKESPKNAKPTTKPSKSVPTKAQGIPEGKRELAERLYLVVKQLNASMAGSITIRLLELDNLPQLMQNPAALKSRVDETVVTLLLAREQHLKRFESAPAGSAAA